MSNRPGKTYVKGERNIVYARDAIGKDGRQFVLPWGKKLTCSTEQAAGRLGVSDQTVRTMCESGELQGWPIRDRKGSPIRVSNESIEHYIDRKIAKFSVSDPKTYASRGLPSSRTQPIPPVK